MIYHAGKILRKARQLRSLSQLEVANRVGIKQAHVSRLERSEGMLTETFQKVLDALGYEIRIQPIVRTAAAEPSTFPQPESYDTVAYRPPHPKESP